MYRQLLRCKIHRATVTESNLEYEGSMTIDEELMAGNGIQHDSSIGHGLGNRPDLI